MDNNYRLGEDVEYKKLGDLFDITAGGDINSDNVSKFKNNNFNVPIYANSLINDGLYGYTSESKIQDPCVTITGRGSIGHAIDRYVPFYPIVRLLVLRDKETICTDKKYIMEAINSIEIFCESTGVPQLTAPQISTYKIPFYSYSLQVGIGNLFRNLDDLINIYTKQKELLEQKKKHYLNVIFNDKNSI